MRNPLDVPHRKAEIDSDVASRLPRSADMEQAVDRREVRLAGVPLGKARHICALFNACDDWSEIILPFVREGLQAGDKALHIVDGRRRAKYLDWLKHGGIDVAEAEDQGRREGAGRLEVKGWDEAYLRGGRFDQHAMLSLIEGSLKAAKGQGYRLTRLIAEMSWALEDLPGVSDLREYEARLNYFLPLYDDPVT
jgi:MEDS: MEthanogen/methylotroph, DcmR Sensory domain